MITIKLGEKNYHIDFISGRALRELEPAAKMGENVSAGIGKGASEYDFSGESGL